MSKLYDDLMESLGEVEAFLDGKASGSRVHTVRTIAPVRVKITARGGTETIGGSKQRLTSSVRPQVKVAS